MGSRGQQQRGEGRPGLRPDRPRPGESASGPSTRRPPTATPHPARWLGFGGGELEKVDNGAMKEAAAQVDRVARARGSRRCSTRRATRPPTARRRSPRSSSTEVAEMASAITPRRHVALPSTASDAFRAGAMNDLAKMMQTDSGREMLAEIANSEHTTRRSTGRGGRRDRGHPRLDPRESALERRRSQPEDPRGVEPTWRRPAWTRPSTTRPVTPRDTAEDSEIPSDVTLYHELVHAWHNEAAATTTA